MQTVEGGNVGSTIQRAHSPCQHLTVKMSPTKGPSCTSCGQTISRQLRGGKIRLSLKAPVPELWAMRGRLLGKRPRVSPSTLAPAGPPGDAGVGVEADNSPVLALPVDQGLRDGDGNGSAPSSPLHSKVKLSNECNAEQGLVPIAPPPIAPPRHRHVVSVVLGSTSSHRGLYRTTVEDDVYCCIKRKESSAAHSNRLPSDYLKYRRLVVEWVFQTALEFDLSRVTAQTAVYLLDRVNTKSHVGKSRIQLVATCCLFLAAKLIECDFAAPSALELRDKCNNTFSLRTMLKMEALLLKSLRWNLSASCPAHACGYLLHKGVLHESDTPPHEHCPNNLQRYLRKYIEFFSDLSVQDHSFLQFPSSIVSAASVAASRKLLRIQPLWSRHLASVTGYELEDIRNCFNMLCRAYHAQFPQPIEKNVVTAVEKNSESPKNALDLDFDRLVRDKPLSVNLPQTY